jgi:hypothetical protein
MAVLESLELNKKTITLKKENLDLLVCMSRLAF